MLSSHLRNEGLILARNETIYAKCPKCDSNLVLMDGIYVINCNDCNLNLEYNIETKKLEILGRNVEFASGKVAKSTKTIRDSTLGPIRRYFPYLLFGIVTLGIGLIIYMMRNLRDLEEHKTYSEVEEGAHPVLSHGDTFLNFNQMVQNRLYYSPRYLTVLFIITISYDLITSAESKYSSLYHHLKGQSKETAPIKSPHAMIYLISLILFIISMMVSIPTGITSLINVLPLVSLTFYIAAGIAGVSFIVIIICGAVWQKAFNEHIKTMKKLGFK